MLISTRFQRFFWGVVCKQLKEQATNPYRYQHPYTGDWYEIDLRKIGDENIYQLLKLVNPNYPKYNNFLPTSTKLITPKEMTDHISWIERWGAENGVQLPYIVSQWEQLLKEAGIQHD